MRHIGIHIKDASFEYEVNQVLFVEQGYDRELNIALDRMMERVYEGGEDSDARMLVFAPYEMRRLMGEDVERFYDVTMPRLGNPYSFLYDCVREGGCGLECGFVQFSRVSEMEGTRADFYPIEKGNWDEGVILDILREIRVENERREEEMRALMMRWQSKQRSSQFNALGFSALTVKRNPNGAYNKGKGKDVHGVIREFLGTSISNNSIDNLPILWIVGVEHDVSCKFSHRMVFKTRDGKPVNKGIRITPYNLALYLALLSEPKGIAAKNFNGNNELVKKFYKLTQKLGRRASKEQMVYNDAENIKSETYKLVSTINKGIDKALGCEYEDVAPLYKICKDYIGNYYVLLPEELYEIWRKSWNVDGVGGKIKWYEKYMRS